MERGITADRDGAWSAVQVRRILESSIGQGECAARDRRQPQEDRRITGRGLPPYGWNPRSSEIVQS
jgi:hypothetical protein